MNTVSWLIYIGSLGDTPAFGMLGFVSFVAAVAATITWWVAKSPGGESDKDAVYVAAITRRVRRVAWPLCVAVWAVAIFIPSKSTMYAIAASQVGEQIVRSEVAADATKALHSWIKKQIEPEAKK